MVTGWTLLIVFIAAYGNALVALIGVRTRVRQGMRLWANDKGYYRPRHLGYLGFYRGLFINLAFAGTSFALTAVVLPGQSDFNKERILGIAAINFVWSLIVACLIPADFQELLHLFKGKFWRVLAVGVFALLIYVITGFSIGQYVASLLVKSH